MAGDQNKKKSLELAELKKEMHDLTKRSVAVLARLRAELDRREIAKIKKNISES